MIADPVNGKVLPPLPGMVIVAIPPPTAAVTPAPAKLIVPTDPCDEPSSCMVIVVAPPGTCDAVRAYEELNTKDEVVAKEELRVKEAVVAKEELIELVAKEAVVALLAQLEVPCSDPVNPSDDTVEPVMVRLPEIIADPVNGKVLPPPPLLGAHDALTAQEEVPNSDPVNPWADTITPVALKLPDTTVEPLIITVLPDRLVASHAKLPSTSL